MKKILTFGEILLRMSPKLGGDWISERNMPTFIGGAELNVATALASWHIPASFMTAMPNNALTNDIEEFIKSKNIGTNHIIKSGERLGIYFLPQGADLKNAGVIYDRAHSSFYSLKTNTIDWNKVFEDVSWFHITAISPALNQEIADLCLEAVKAAKNLGVNVSIDLNYRAKLWKFGKEPVEVMPEIVNYCDLVMGNIWAANKLLGISINDSVSSNNVKEKEYLKQSIESSKEIIEKFPSVKYVANTFRFDFETEGIEYYTTWFQNNDLYVSPHFKVKKVLDRIGSGDCFMAGLLYGLYQNNQPQDIIDYAAGAAIGKLNEYGDATSQTVEEVKTIIKKYKNIQYA